MSLPAPRHPFAAFGVSVTPRARAALMLRLISVWSGRAGGTHHTVCCGRKSYRDRDGVTAETKRVPIAHRHSVPQMSPPIVLKKG